ncbi:NAD-dependent epimerase/dehydratase family protein [Paenibacillus pasadenensis]|uniref:NAD-dependent epimerase/dehydratase family protein n=1 Tax=Paenibacillus pasadenensis TaxID=217090 RepID=UPI00203D21ED|nr:NAD-dependent epimerase/dehydratase family protein [Paenibacillus pasadenensis]MCM3746828.1 NAD-dependent epimerase/dehydratase family protein [Paenibacillus pasadenensis]
MKIVVTGAAGFIGSHLCEFFLQHTGHEVVGIDGMVREEFRQIDTRNMELFLDHPRFSFMKANLLQIDWAPVLADADIVCHLAGIPGVRSSFGSSFIDYIDGNIMATQRLLEACAGTAVQKVVFASTSSVYGEKSGPVSEEAVLKPLSPYGVTKQTGEQLCRVYRLSDGIPAVVLRFFTVYGPRQRSDMAFHLFIRHMLAGEPLRIYGDGTQTRDFTYVLDCVRGTAAAALQPGLIGETINIGGAQRASVNEIIGMLEKLTGTKANVVYTGSARGEPKHTWADISKAHSLLGYKPQVTLQQGLSLELDDLKKLYS